MTASTTSSNLSQSSFVDLSGVPETMLWPLWNRLAESRRSDRLIDDRMAANLATRINYDYRSNFGNPTPHHAIRARYCDDLIRSYTKKGYDQPVVVSLGDGLETQMWRLDIPDLPWISVDLPESIAVRKELLPADDRSQLIAKSALDLSWLDDLPETETPFISAAGLLMYFKEEQVEDLLTAILNKFKAPEIFFDTITPSVSKKTLAPGGLKMTKYYTAPPMPWGIVYHDIDDFIRQISPDVSVSVTPYHLAFPKRTRLYRALSLIPGVARAFAGALVHIKR